MRKIFTSIDLGSNEIKALVLEKFNEKFNVLASSKVKTKGIKKGLITDDILATNAIKEAIKELENKLGTKISQVIVNVPLFDEEFNIVTGQVEITNENKTINADDISNCLKNCIKNNKVNDKKVVTISPIEYDVDDKKNKNPLGMHGEYLKVKAVVSLVPQKNILSIIKIFSNLNIKVKDILFETLGDYYAGKTSNHDKMIGVIINIGYEKTLISIFNKGIMIKNEMINVGSKNIDNDISFIYKLGKKEVQNLKKNFVIANKRYADIDEKNEASNEFGETIKIMQDELASIVESRIIDILKNVKSEIKNLTNREIGYIIITGGLTNMLGFGATLEEVFGINASTLNMNILGIRDNSYSSCFGMIKYYDYKLLLNDTEDTMFNDEMVNDIIGKKKKNDNNVLSKMFERFFE